MIGGGYWTESTGEVPTVYRVPKTPCCRRSLEPLRDVQAKMVNSMQSRVDRAMQLYFSLLAGWCTVVRSVLNHDCKTVDTWQKRKGRLPVKAPP